MVTTAGLTRSTRSAKLNGAPCSIMRGGFAPATGAGIAGCVGAALSSGGGDRLSGPTPKDHAPAPNATSAIAPTMAASADLEWPAPGAGYLAGGGAAGSWASGSVVILEIPRVNVRGDGVARSKNQPHYDIMPLRLHIFNVWMAPAAPASARNGEHHRGAAH